MPASLNPAESAQALFIAEQSGEKLDLLTGTSCPQTPEQGYAIQAVFAELRNEAIAGWKIAATAQAGRDHINVDRPLGGRLLESAVSGDGSTVNLRHNRMRVAEVEIVLMLGQDLSPQEQDFTEEQVAAAIISVHPGLEFPDSRFADFTRVGAACLIADNACASRFVLGPPNTSDIDLAALAQLKTSLLINDQTVTSGRGSDALGGPVTALVWLANTLSRLGQPIKAGQFVTTGVTGNPSPVAPGDQVRADLGELGSVCARMTD
ncbi:MAG: 2-keto-4-pentenoate hydratase [Burkholderiaceae bacterium]